MFFSSAKAEYEERAVSKSETRKILMPKEVEDALLNVNGPSQMFFLDKVDRDRFDEAVLEVDYRSNFPNLYHTHHKLRKTYADSHTHGVYMLNEEYRICSNGKLQACVERITRTMALTIPPGGLDGIISPDFQGYLDALLVKFKKCVEEEPNIDFILTFDSPHQEKQDWEKRDIEEEMKFLQLLHALCTLMCELKYCLKVIVIFNDINLFWDQFFSHTSVLEDTTIRSVCTAYKFDEKEHWKQVWPEQTKTQ